MILFFIAFFRLRRSLFPDDHPMRHAGHITGDVARVDCSRNQGDLCVQLLYTKFGSAIVDFIMKHTDFVSTFIDIRFPLLEMPYHPRPFFADQPKLEAALLSFALLATDIALAPRYVPRVGATARPTV
jgi:hypothetical protein